MELGADGREVPGRLLQLGPPEAQLVAHGRDGLGQDDVAPVHLLEQPDAVGSVGRGLSGQQVDQRRRGSHHVRLPGPLGLPRAEHREPALQPHDLLLRSVDANQRVVDLVLVAADPRGQAVHPVLERPQPGRASPDLRLRVAQLLARVMQSVAAGGQRRYGRREHQHRKDEQRRRETVGTGGCAGSAGLRSSHIALEGTRRLRPYLPQKALRSAPAPVFPTD
jgi:hypothetical protein